MAQIVDMANLEARLTTLGSQVEHLAQIVQKGTEVSEESITDDWMDELNGFTADIKQTRTQLCSFSQRWHDATIVKSEDVTRLERREEEIKMKEELLEQKTAEMTKREELLEQKAAEMTKKQELWEQKAAEVTKSMSGAAEELRNATETESKAREALQQVLARQNASRFNTKSAKRGPVLSSPEKPAPKRRQARGGSAGAAEVLANVEQNELLANTTQTFGSPSRRRRPLTPFTGHMTASRSGVSSPALNPTPATRQDLTVNPRPDTLVPPGQGVDPATNPSGLSVASEHVRNVWRQIEFPANWTAADSAILLDNFEEARRRKGGKDNRQWPQQSMDRGSQVNYPYCLTRDLRRNGMRAPGGRCESHTPNQLCIDVFYTTDNPREYNSAATDKRWRLEKRE